MKIIKDVIALRFKTSDSDGVILHGEGQQGDYITLELHKAKLLLQINLGAQIHAHRSCTQCDNSETRISNFYNQNQINRNSSQR